MKTMICANVRDYQGHNNVNNDIKETLSNGTNEDFWWLNNGVTIIASEASLVTGKELLVVDPEIVNGLQTSNEIYDFFSSNPGHLENETRNVLVRIIVPSDETSRDRIILATNSQTSIPPVALRATDPIHRQIEMYFKNRGLYYDRRKNYYKNQGKNSSEIVSISFLGQCLMSLFLQKPNYARARPSTLLNNDEYYKSMYIDCQDLEVFYRAASLGKKIERIIKKQPEYTAGMKNDIIFYVLYFVVGKTLNATAISVEQIKEIDLSSITDAFVIDSIEKVYAEYSALGGTSTIAKGSDLITSVQALIATPE